MSLSSSQDTALSQGSSAETSVERRQGSPRSCEDFASLAVGEMPRLTGSQRLSDELYNKRWLLRVQRQIVVDANGCWLWQGFIHRNGYGSTGYRDKSPRIHRKVFELTKEPIPPGMDVCHTCDVRHCINPDHLWLGTRKQNLVDCHQKGRHFLSAKTHCKRGHEFTPENTYYKTCPSKYGTYQTRACRACERRKNRLRAGWDEDEALSVPPIAPGAMTPRRRIGVRNNGRRAA